MNTFAREGMFSEDSVMLRYSKDCIVFPSLQDCQSEAEWNIRITMSAKRLEWKQCLSMSCFLSVALMFESKELSWLQQKGFHVPELLLQELKLPTTCSYVLQHLN